MFALQTLSTLIWGNSESTDLMHIQSGQLYLTSYKRPEAQKLIFENAKATIQRTRDEFQYNLIINRDYEEGKGTLGDNEKPDKMIFPIDEKMNASIVENNRDVHTLSWKQSHNSKNDLYEFKCINASADHLKLFYRTLRQCMYEKKYKKSHKQATEEHLEQFDPKAVKLPRVGENYNIFGVVLQDVVVFLVFSPEEEDFIPIDTKAKASILEVGKFAYILEVESNKCVKMRQSLMPDMNANFSILQLRFTWCHFADEKTFTFSLKFKDSNSISTFQLAFSRCVYETLQQSNYEKVKREDRDYIFGVYQQDEEMTDEENSDQEDEDVSESESEVEKEEFSFSSEGGDRPIYNSQLAIGAKNDQSFVIRGDKVGVFKFGNNEELEHQTTINNLRNLKKESLTPRKVLLHDQDRSMLLLDPDNDNNKIFDLNLEYGKVIEEWKVHDDIPVNFIAPSNKFSQLTHEPTIIGLSNNSLFRIDSRLPGNKLVEQECKSYASKNGLTCATVTEKGWIAAGSEKGEIRLFDRLGINAKSLLPAVGDAIIGIDVTADGKWLIATCPTYLLLIDCELDSISGFTKSFPKDKKPKPKKLQLKPEDIAYMNEPVHFTPAKFNVGIDEIERTIVTSTGPYIVTWNFRRVKQGKLNDYQLKSHNDTVVAGNFKFGQDRNIVVALPHDVTLVNKKQLRSPKQSLRTEYKHS